MVKLAVVEPAVLSRIRYEIKQQHVEDIDPRKLQASIIVPAYRRDCTAKDMSGKPGFHVSLAEILNL